MLEMHASKWVTIVKEYIYVSCVNSCYSKQNKKKKKHAKIAFNYFVKRKICQWKTFIKKIKKKGAGGLNTAMV